jgi:hypothetical protein
MKRRDLVKLAAAPLAVAGLPMSLATAAGSATGSSIAKLGTPELQLSMRAGRGLECRLVHVPSGFALATGAYSYSFGNPLFREIHRSPEALVLQGRTESGIGIEHRFSVTSDSTALEEQITVTNHSAAVLDLSAARCGFVLPIALSEAKSAQMLAQHRFAAVPFLREPSGNPSQYSEYSLGEILGRRFTSELWQGWTGIPVPLESTAAYAAEGWIWRRGDLAFLITKYSQAGMEWSLLDRLPLSDNSQGLRWGGFGSYRGNPDESLWLPPHESHRFGAIRVTPFRGDRNQGFYAFRKEMAARGHRHPEHFDPPLHWNELYDNKLFFLPDSDNPDVRRKYYSLADMRAAAAKAKWFGCEALYLDPGWDTNFASKIWDQARLGSLESFTSMLRSDYGLKCSLHTPLSGWCNPTSYPSDCYRLDRFDRRARWQGQFPDIKPSPGYPPICGASNQYMEETRRRLEALAAAGVIFFMFDGTMYHAECWDANHGHVVPARTQAHVAATVRLARLVHEKFPDVLIEMHDPVVGGFHSHYTPVYYGHGAHGFDSVWAFELMWNPMDDLMSGRAIALYYYNLAYSLPLYIHIDLRTDNANALVFWWNASTCRHLGVGGTHPDPAVVSMQREAVRHYRRLKSYFSRGRFYGIDELTHVHVNPEATGAVINCFNLKDLPETRAVLFSPRDCGLDPTMLYKFSQGTAGGNGASEELYTLQVAIAAQGHTLIEVTQARS